MSEIDEKQLVLYAQMANLVSLILQWPNINIKEIAENFSKVIFISNFRFCFNNEKLSYNVDLASIQLNQSKLHPVWE